jgi:uncharacterized protein (TIGR02246 family)
MLKAWVEAYIRAWNSNDPNDIGALFTDDALYYTEPFAEPWRGREQIVERWLERKDEPGQTTFVWRRLVETPETAVIVGTTTYRAPPRVYSNLWVIRLNHEGRCLEFTEWWMEQPAAE